MNIVTIEHDHNISEQKELQLFCCHMDNFTLDGKGKNYSYLQELRTGNSIFKVQKNSVQLLIIHDTDQINQEH